MKDLIAVIDDMELVMVIIRDTLVNAGYENILTYEDSIQAYADLLDKTELRLVITDYEMPCLNGVILLSNLKAFHPGIEGIIVTGNAEAVECLKERYTVIQKGMPDFTKRLLQCVEIALGKRGLP